LLITAAAGQEAPTSHLPVKQVEYRAGSEFHLNFYKLLNKAMKAIPQKWGKAVVAFLFRGHAVPSRACRSMAAAFGGMIFNRGAPASSKTASEAVFEDPDLEMLC
jgi:hypothetical protein